MKELEQAMRAIGSKAAVDRERAARLAMLDGDSFVLLDSGEIVQAGMVRQVMPIADPRAEDRNYSQFM